MFTSRKERTRDLVMRIRRRCNRSRINHFNKLVERFRRDRVKFSPDRVSSGKIEIVDSAKIGRRNFSIKASVVASNMANSDDANAQFRRPILALSTISILPEDT